MKKKQASKWLVLTLFILSLSGLKAQSPNCSYFVDNAGLCTVTVQVDFYAGATMCNSSGAVSIGMGQTFFSCSCPGTLTDVVVTVTSIGGATLNGTGTVNVNNQQDHDTLSGTASCPISTNYTLDWATNGSTLGY